MMRLGWDFETLGFYNTQSNFIFSSHIPFNAGYSNSVGFGTRDVIILQHELVHGWGANDYFYDTITDSNGVEHDDLVQHGWSIVDGDARRGTIFVAGQTFDVSLSAVQNFCIDANTGADRPSTNGGGLASCNLVADGYPDFPWAMRQVNDGRGNSGIPIHSYPYLNSYSENWSTLKINDFAYGENQHNGVRSWYDQWS